MVQRALLSDLPFRARPQLPTTACHCCAQLSNRAKQALLLALSTLAHNLTSSAPGSPLNQKDEDG